MLDVMEDMTQAVRDKFTMMGPWLGERTRRLWAASEARAIGRGGIRQVSEATGMSRSTVRAGLKELETGQPLPVESTGGRLRSPGGGRKRLTERDPRLAAALEGQLDPVTRGDPTGPLRWTCSSAARLAERLRGEGHRVSERTVNRLLHEMGYSLQGNRKTLEGRQHPDRDAQFRHISRRVEAFQRQGQPVVSVDTKKKELIGPYRNGGREWRPKGEPEAVKVHDFVDPELGKAIPYGVYDMTANAGWVSVGVDHDTAEFAVETVRRWWRQMGRLAYPQAERLLITADGGGSNSSRSRLWEVRNCRIWPMGSACRCRCVTSRPARASGTRSNIGCFCHITENWRGRPLVSREVVVNLIGATTTRGGLAVQSELDEGRYPTGKKMTDEQMARLSIERDAFHGEWNYSLSPRTDNG